jgi:hypothetical protein
MAASSRFGSLLTAWTAFSLLLCSSLTAFAWDVPLSPAVSEEDLSCTQDEPLIAKEWNFVEPRSSMRWQLPVSSTTSTLTEAFFRVEFVRPHPFQNWEARVMIYFVNPLPYAIPFTFQHVALEWTDASGRRMTAIDWSDICTAPGRSIYPGQDLRFTISLPETVGIRRLEMPRVRVWGSRN